ncbi:hypothetical protein L21_0822 [Methanoculleus chikugoensis]|jgi:hypothetical protein|uniref:Uncharacterized protein n=1 Tax=Methanoculleus chikugoensis TaxID=118126 RepID=A0A1M4MJ49_9EURY|nr:hypothetical protein [Methanoculleus chikugoensis]NMA11391.1 hypothetical protein [Methanomicrobiales archaeon]SCL74935.1 hypothetical protein L21_0822 [Methanoculleus chikugoensis]
MSLDFLAGFTIFMLALIMVVSMVPGLLAGLESSGIDYDAVAYRTGVILAEDPGWPVYPPWEMKTEAYKDEIDRMGLAVSKDTPNILLSTKVNAFFNYTFFTEDDYRSKAIFGDVPYSYNFSLRSEDWTYNNATGGTPPSGHGYIRRAVKIKEPGVANISYNSSFNETALDASKPRVFTVRLNFSQLLDPERGPAYRIDPRTEPVNITITEFGRYLNGTAAATNATLKDVTFWKMDPTTPMPRFTKIPFSYNTMDPDLYTLFLDRTQNDLVPGTNVSDNISLVLKPAATSIFTLDQNSILDIRFTFDDGVPQRTFMNGTYLYDYDNVTCPPLKPAVLEVAIW